MAVIGIDLGTTYSAVAVSEDGVGARVLPNLEGMDTTPSVVYFPGTETGTEEPLVGAMAKNSAAAAPSAVVRSIKRMMGDPDYRYYSLNGNEFHPEEVSALILKYLKQYAELDLGEKVEGAVVTVPAYFDDARRTATKQAGKLAGLNVLQVFNEPTAAAIAYGVDERDAGRVLVYDLGGGTFDVTLLDIRDGRFDVIATGGDPELGGDDFDRELARLIKEELARQGRPVDEYEDDALLAEIDEKAEVMKRSLTNVAQATSIFTVYNQLINHVGTEALLSGPFDSLLGTDMYNLTNNIFQTAVIPIGESILALFMLVQLVKISQRIDATSTLPAVKEIVFLAVIYVMQTAKAKRLAAK